VQYQPFYEQLSTTSLCVSASAVLISTTFQRRGPTKVGYPTTIVLDRVFASGLGSASFVTLSVSGTVIDRLGYPANGTAVHNPCHIQLPINADLEVHASATGAITVNFHRL